MKKTNIVLDIGIPLIGCLACGMMISMLWQMRSANQIAQLAEQNGPMKVEFEELLTRDELAQQHVELSNAHVAPKYSLSKQDYGMSGCFLLFPEQRFEIDPNRLPIIIQVSTIENQEGAAQFSKQKTFTGTVSNYWSLNFDHQRILKLCYPELELDRCVVISSPGRCYSKDANFVAISGMIFFSVLLLAFFAWLCRSMTNAFKQGLTFSPSSEVPPAPTKPSFYHDTNWRAELGEVASDSKIEKDVSYVPRMYSLSYIAKVLGVAAFTPTLMMALAWQSQSVASQFISHLLQIVSCICLFPNHLPHRDLVPPKNRWQRCSLGNPKARTSASQIPESVRSMRQNYRAAWVPASRQFPDERKSQTGRAVLPFG